MPCFKLAGNFGLLDSGVVHGGLGGSSTERGKVAFAPVFRGEREGMGSGIFSLYILIAKGVLFTLMFSCCMAYVCVTSGPWAGV